MAGLGPAIHDFKRRKARCVGATHASSAAPSPAPAKAWMAGPSPAMAGLLVQRLVEVVPFRVHAVDEADLPGARPVLDRLLALDRVADVFETLVVDETLEAVAAR